MYIITKYWGNYIGETDDSLTLLEYLADKQKEEISFGEIISDTGLNKLNNDFRCHEEPLTATLVNADSDCDPLYVEFYYAIDVIANLAALLLECKVNGSIDLCELAGYDLETNVPTVRITAKPEEHALIDKALLDFTVEPLAYDISEMAGEEDTLAMAAVCEQLREELYG